MDAPAARRSGGRPRHFDPETERALLVRSARQLLRRQPYDTISLSAILAASGLHTRAFYRHFASKDALLLWIYQDNADALARILERRVTVAASGAKAVVAWIDEMLRLRFDQRAVGHVVVFEDASVQRVVKRLGGDATTKELLVAPLVKAVERGGRDGSLHSCEPRAHAAFVWSVVWGDLDWLAAARRGRELPRTTAQRVIAGFCLRAVQG